MQTALTALCSGKYNVAVDGSVTMTPIARASWPLGQGDIAIAKGLMHKRCNLGVWGSKPAHAEYALPQLHLPQGKYRGFIFSKMSSL